MNNKDVKILFVTNYYFPSTTGTAVVIKNLVDGLDPNLIAGIVTQANSFSNKENNSDNHKVFYLFRYLNLIQKRFWYYGRILFSRFELKKLCNIIKNENVTHVIGVYPDLDFLELAHKASDLTNRIFFPYLNDTVVEGLSHTKYAERAKTVQNKLFKEKYKIFVMSKGMQNLYKRKYCIETIPILHSFSEDKTPQNIEVNTISNSIFWGGAIYYINKNSVWRVHNACMNLTIKLTLSSSNKMRDLIRMGFKQSNLEILPFLTRTDYLRKLEQQDALLLGIDWPDESPYHVDELSTIFPTKTIEYLVSGRPIIVHCPDNYFLAEFFREHDCGILICERDISYIELEIKKFLGDKDLIRKKIDNAFNASRQFHTSNVVKVFKSEIM